MNFRVKYEPCEARALAGIIIHRGVTEAYDKRHETPPFGIGFLDGYSIMPFEGDFPKQLSPVTDFEPRKLMGVGAIRAHEVLYQGLIHTVMFHVHRIGMQAVQEPERDEKFTGIFRRYKEVLALANELDNDRHSQYSFPGLFIQTGLNSGAYIMTQILRALPDILRNEGLAVRDAESFVKIARASTPHVLRLTSLLLNHFVSLNELMSLEGAPSAFFNRPNWNPRAFILKFKNGVFTIEINKAVIDIAAEHSEETGFTATSCPGRMRIDGKSAVEILWEWLLEIAPAFYGKIMAGHAA